MRGGKVLAVTAHDRPYVLVTLYSSMRVLQMTMSQYKLPYDGVMRIDDGEDFVRQQRAECVRLTIRESPKRHLRWLELEIATA